MPSPNETPLTVVCGYINATAQKNLATESNFEILSVEPSQRSYQAGNTKIKYRIDRSTNDLNMQPDDPDRYLVGRVYVDRERIGADILSPTVSLLNTQVGSVAAAVTALNAKYGVSIEVGQILEMRTSGSYRELIPKPDSISYNGPLVIQVTTS